MASRTVISRITGRVQGVGYRMWIFDEATRRGLNGWVRNCPDGSVEALLSGEAEAVTDLMLFCYIGPSSANVTSVVSDPSREDPGKGFEVRNSV